ncbi:protein unc-13 homolog 4B-like isoform X2 [Homarus americanus]|uniref:protein unc-13 homolog 4B-like isoform X2 n=1 Tax=Homarus americanus TaxID=6706 RepID=UPI001C456D7F|nr:protein unc-13 homolog 4B-like isoform X2 [Homarus americanus]
MGQAALKPSRAAVLGQVDVGLEALFMLESREEHSTVVVKMVPTSLPLPRKIKHHQGRRICRTHSIREAEETAEEEEEDQSLGEVSLSVTSGYGGLQCRDMAEDHLADVYYSAFHLHLSREALLSEAFKISATTDEGVNANPQANSSDTTRITREELLRTLRDIFGVNEAMVKLVDEEVQAREPPRMTLHINIHEAKELRPKTPKETSHPYCFVRVSGCSETFKTRVLNNDLSPSWESQFSTHEPQEAGVEQLKGMRDIREFSRLVRDAAANIQMNEMRNLLGTVTVPLSEMKDQSLTGWYNLVKSKEEEISLISQRESFRANKKRGSLRLSLKLSTVSQLNLIGPHWFDAFLKKVVLYYLEYRSSYGSVKRGGKRWRDRSIHSTGSANITSISTSSTKDCNVGSGNSSSGSSFENETFLSLATPWNGSLSNTIQVLLDHYAATLNLTPPFITLSWWKITSEFFITEQSFLGQLLKTIQGYMAEEKYSEEEIQEIRSSLRKWTSTQFNRLRNLITYFPASNKFVSCPQLEGMLRNLHAIEANPETRQLKVFPKDISVNEQVSEALTDYLKIWWESSLKNRRRNSPTATEDQQLVAAVGVTGEVYTFLSDVCKFYHDVFSREAKISYLRLTYIFLTSELGARVRPLLLKIYDTPSKEKHTHATSSVKHDEADRRALEAGTPVWQLYKKFDSIQKIGENLPDEVQLQTGIRGYHKWFLGGVIRWQERMLVRTRALVTKDVERDEFEVAYTVTNSEFTISLSACETKSNFTIINDSWQRLAWADEVGGEKVAKRLLQDLCGLGTLYTKLVMAKLDSSLREETVPDSMFLPTQTCIGLNNIEYLRQEIDGLPTLLKLSNDDDKEQFSVVKKTSSKMEGSLLLFMDNVIKKIKPILSRAVVGSCDTGNEAQLLQEVLDDRLYVLLRRLDDSNFQRFLLKIWKALILIFCSIVESNSNKRNAEYFKNVCKVLERTWYFFTPTDRRGLDPQEAHCTEYQSLQKTLCNLKMPTESLIAKYYKERYEELQRAHSSYTAELIVQAFFKRTGKLIVEVVMARNICKPSGKLPDTFVQIKLVPSEWFPNISSPKTKNQKRSDAPVFQEKFEFPISPTDHGVKSGHLLFILKNHQIFQSGEAIGETVIPLDGLPSVDTSMASPVQNKVLNMNMPKAGDDYTSIKALQFRTRDKRAVNFLQKIPTRS